MGLSTQTLDESKMTNAIKRLYVNRMNNGLFEIKLHGGGEVPDILKGTFTSLQAADNHLYFYILNKTTIPEKPNGSNKRS